MAKFVKQGICMDYTDKNFEKQLETLQSLINEDTHNNTLLLNTLKSMMDDPNKKHFRRWKFIRWLFGKKVAAVMEEEE